MLKAKIQYQLNTLNPYSLEEKEINTYCTNFKVSLLNKNGSLGIWSVSFKLEEYQMYQTSVNFNKNDKKEKQKVFLDRRDNIKNWKNNKI